jgi:predicted Zn-dependent protease
MVKFRKYEEKLSKYFQRLSEIKFKAKLKRLVFRIGIYHQDEFELSAESPKQLNFPCQLGVLFCGDFKDTLYDTIKMKLNQTFDSLFYNFRNLGDYSFSKELFEKGVKNEFKMTKENNERIGLHPTNKFYRILIEKRKEEEIDMILFITNLPLYSSSEENILFLFGETHLRHLCSIVSTLTLKEKFYNREEDQELFNERIIKETLHEIGHLIFGPSHCENNLCVMHFSNDVEDIDNKSIYLCKKCGLKLSKIRNSYNLN